MRTPHPARSAKAPPDAANRVPVSDGWIHELKHDGFRMLAFKDGEAVRLWSLNGRDWSAEFVAIKNAMRVAAVQSGHWSTSAGPTPSVGQALA